MTTILPEEVLIAASRLKELRAASAQIEAEEKQVRALIMNALGDEDRGITASGAPVAHIQVQHRRTVNKDKLEALHPEIFDEVVEEVEVHILRIDL